MGRINARMRTNHNVAGTSEIHIANSSHLHGLPLIGGIGTVASVGPIHGGE
jgi:hypothetical protein